MNKAETKKRIERLKKVINYHRYLYHVLDEQEISDATLDSLKRELYNLEQQYPDLITIDSPTQRVGGKPLDKFEKVRHNIPMLSIEDIFDKNELLQWQDYLRKLEPLAKIEYFCEPKIDGFAVSLIYKNGILTQAATRGDGHIGENVTQNIKTIQSIPLKLYPYKPLSREIEPLISKERIKELIKKDRFEIRGEVFMTKSSFNKINKQRVKDGENPYANPRNLAAGSIRQLDSKSAASRDLKFLAYDISSDIPSDIPSDTRTIKHSEKHKLLYHLGFRVEKGKICKNSKEITNFWKKTQEKREILPFQVDGVVILVNDTAIFDKLGVAGKSPRAIRAFKFQAKQATTKIKDIKIQVGRTGAITPVAVLKPIKIGGTTITHATLHNEDQIKRLDVKLGDTVIIERAGDVIPAVSRVLTELRTGKETSFYFPKTCPICSTKLIKPKGEVIWRCPNLKCSARKMELLEHFVSKKAFNIEGLGPKVIKQLTTQGLISQPKDLFQLRENDLVVLERFAKKSAQNLIKEIQKRKEISLSSFIYSLGIRYVGEETAIDLAERFKGLEKLKRASLEELKTISDIGTVGAESVYKWFRKDENIELLKNLKMSGIKILLPQQRGDKLLGNIFVITGTLKTISREMAIARIRALGGSSTTSVSKNTDFLVVGQEPGNKVEKARKLRVKTLSEKEFLDILNTYV